MDMRSWTTPHGKTLDVSLMGFGAAPLGDLFQRLDESVAQATIAAALDAGVTLFDTSPHYGNGLAEARLGSVLRSRPRESVVVSTKVGRVMDPFSPVEKPRDDVVSPGFAGGFPAPRALRLFL